MLYIFRNYIKVLLANVFVHHWFQIKYQFYKKKKENILSPKYSDSPWPTELPAEQHNTLQSMFLKGGVADWELQLAAITQHS